MTRLHARKAASFRPSVEVLEARNLLSTFTVDHLADDLVGSGLSGSLRYCITNATDGDDIQFGDGVTGTINLTGALPILTHSISINGPGADQLTVRRDTGGDYRIFTVAGPITVGISGLTITNGSDLGGGGILNQGSTLTLTNATISGNAAAAPTGGAGGGIYNLGGTLTLSNSSVSGNSAIMLGGGIFNGFGGTLSLSNSTISGNSCGVEGSGGGIRINSGTVTLSNSTVSGNTVGVGGDGGGMANAFGTLIMSNSTVSGNSASDGGGIANTGTLTLSSCTVSGNSCGVEQGTNGGISSFGEGMLNARNTIIAGNTAPTDPDLGGDLGSLGHNLIGNTQGGSGFDPTDLLNINPLLGPLQDNGGPTQTMALLPGSPAIDAGDNTDAPDWDQRGEGFARIVGIIDPNNPVIDIGAFEVQADSGPRPPSWAGFLPGVIQTARPGTVAGLGVSPVLPAYDPGSGARPGPVAEVLLASGRASDWRLAADAIPGRQWHQADQLGMGLLEAADRFGLQPEAGGLSAF
jgi:hypothetical protein